MIDVDLGVPKDDFGWSGDIEDAFTDQNGIDINGKGINAGVVEQISWWKGEPQWMTHVRLRSLHRFENEPTAGRFAVDTPDIDFQDIDYHPRPNDEQVDEWRRLPEQMMRTDEQIGIVGVERRHLAGITARYESDVVYQHNRDDLVERGILFCDMDTALREYPHLVKEYFGTVVPPGDNTFAALNTSVWSGGSFIYVPPGVECEMPLQAYART
ncbi:MAG: Fe-S cluster assembly protein SufB, partial [Ilumatobacteraceae bacterium]